MRRSLAPFVEGLRAAERWVLPGECLLCRARVGSDDPLACGVCRSRWLPVPEPQCSRCGQPILAGRECRVCPEWPAEFGPVASAVWLDESARRAVHLLKYEGWRRMAECLAAKMATVPVLRNGGVLVPIPLGRARRKARGYNQSAEIVAALSTKLGLVMDEGLLERIRETRSQTALSPDEREANLRMAFASRSALPERIVLIDDVFTTGATLASAARALIGAGARSVAAATFARAELPLAAIGRLV